jgi:O-antigen ligase
MYIIVNTLLYNWNSFFDYNFYRRDGNFFITFSPLLVLSLTKLNLNLNIFLKRYIIICTIINFLFICIYLITGGTIFLYERNLYHLLFFAHNAAGGFLAILSVFSYSYYKETKKFHTLLLLLINLFGLYLTNSRGSILAFVVSFIIIVIFKNRHNIIIVFSIVIFQLIIFTWGYTNITPAELNNGQVAKINVIKQDIIKKYLNINRSYTISFRLFYIWPRAVYLFLESPIFGTGFGSYDDFPYKLSNNIVPIKFNQSDNIQHSDSHAHQSFLNILAELGIVGLLVTIILLFYIYKHINKLSDQFIKDSLNMAFWVNIISSMTEHRLFTPSQMLPFILILGLSISTKEANYATSTDIFNFIKNYILRNRNMYISIYFKQDSMLEDKDI